MPVVSRRDRRDEVRIHYEVRGDERAPVLLLVRGLARSARYWSCFVDHVEGDYRLVLVDNRGVGFSNAPAPPYTTRSMADDIASVLDHAGIERAHVFGISLGGMIAQKLAVHHADRVDKLVLGCTTMRGPGVFPSAAYALVRSMTLPFEEALRYTAPIVLGGRALREKAEIVEEWRELGRKERPRRHGLLGQFAAATFHDSRRELARIRSETLIVTGDDDRLMPAPQSYLLAESIPGARLRVVRDAGHDFPVEAPEATASVLRDFLL